MTTEVQTNNLEDSDKVKTSEETVDPNNVSTTLSIAKEIQIVDLNNGIVNFEATFTVKNEDKKPFKIIAINENALDNVEALEYKVAEQGIISGQIFSDIEQTNSFVLVLKNINEDDEEIPVQVDITRKEIKPWSRTKKPMAGPKVESTPPKQTPQKPAETPHKPESKPEKPKNSSKTIEKYETTPKKQGFFTKYRIYIFIFLFLVLAGFGAYWFFSSKSAPKIEVSDVVSDTASVVDISATPKPSPEIPINDTLVNSLNDIKIPTLTE